MNNFNIKKGWAVARINLKSFITFSVILLAAFVVIDLPGVVLSLTGGNVEGLGLSSLIYAFAFIIPIMLAGSNFQKTMRMGTKKRDYFVGVFLLLSLLAAAISFAGIVLYYAVDKPLSDLVATMYSLYSVLGFAANGILTGFLQQFGFVFFLSVAVFLFACIQDTWKGWLADVLIVLFSVITLTVSALREFFWDTILYLTVTGHPAAQICFTLFGGGALYLLYLLILKRKKI